MLLLKKFYGELIAELHIDTYNITTYILRNVQILTNTL